MEEGCWREEKGLRERNDGMMAELMKEEERNEVFFFFCRNEGKEGGKERKGFRDEV